MDRMNASTNILNWVEIPVIDLERAQRFYEQVFELQMRRLEFDTEEIALFPGDPHVIQATSGRVSGCLVKKPGAQPSQTGVLIYLNAYPEIQPVIDRIVANGGEIVVPKTQQFYGFYAVFVDSEGNKLALHAEQ